MAQTDNPLRTMAQRRADGASHPPAKTAQGPARGARLTMNPRPVHSAFGNRAGGVFFGGGGRIGRIGRIGWIGRIGRIAEAGAVVGAVAPGAEKRQQAAALQTRARGGGARCGAERMECAGLPALLADGGAPSAARGARALPEAEPAAFRILRE